MSASKFTCDDPTVSEKPKVPRYCDCADCAPSYAITDTLYAQCIGLDASDLAYAAATLLAVAASQASDDLTDPRTCSSTLPPSPAATWRACIRSPIRPSTEEIVMPSNRERILNLTKICPLRSGRCSPWIWSCGSASRRCRTIPAAPWISWPTASSRRLPRCLKPPAVACDHRRPRFPAASTSPYFSERPMMLHLLVPAKLSAWPQSSPKVRPEYLGQARIVHREVITADRQFSKLVEQHIQKLFRRVKTKGTFRQPEVVDMARAWQHAGADYGQSSAYNTLSFDRHKGRADGRPPGTDGKPARPLG